MTGGLIQLAAIGVQNMFLTDDPQITFFKMVYRRHTNFSIEPIIQKFINDPNFKKKTSCTISKSGDLMSQIFLVVTLPQIRKFSDPNIKFAWAKKIGLAMINNIEMEIGGEVIDRHYGDWLNIWFELTQKNVDVGFNKMIGNIPELYEFTNGKDSYELYIPLQFWFCKNTGQALPLISLQYSDVKINVEFNEFDKCHLVTPTHYIELEDDFVPFKQFDYIQQDLKQNDKRFGMFLYFDINTKRMYYSKISDNNFESNNLSASSKLRLDKNYPFNIIDNSSDIYRIFNTFTNTWVYPKIGTPESPSKPFIFMNSDLSNNLSSVVIPDCHLIVDYYYIDEDERSRFANSRHDYLIEQVQFSGEKTFDSPNNTINVDFLHPSKFIVWVTQQSYLLNKENNDVFNYTNDYRYVKNVQIGDTLINDETFYINSQERLSRRNWAYFNYVQPYQCFSFGPSEGINVYSFSIIPEKNFPSGSCNMSQIDNSFVKFSTESIISSTNKGKFRAYSVGYNIYRIVNGLGGIVFQ